MFELLFIKNSRPENCEDLRWNFSEFYDLNQNLLLNNTFRKLKLKNNIYRSKELSPRRKASIKVRRWICSFPDIIGIAFGNEVSLTSKQIFLLERSTFLLFFEKSLVDLHIYFSFELQNVYISRDGTVKQCPKDWKLNGNLQLNEIAQHTSCYGCTCLHKHFWLGISHFLLSNWCIHGDLFHFFFFWVRGARKYLRSFGMLALAWGSHF